MTRTRFDEQLEELHVELIKMGSLCEEAISLSARALEEEDKEIEKRVFHLETEIDEMERTIETLCMRLLLHQQPVARDLRTISAALKMISDMERNRFHGYRQRRSFCKEKSGSCGKSH